MILGGHQPLEHSTLQAADLNASEELVFSGARTAGQFSVSAHLVRNWCMSKAVRDEGIGAALLIV